MTTKPNLAINSLHVPSLCGWCSGLHWKLDPVSFSAEEEWVGTCLDKNVPLPCFLHSCCLNRYQSSDSVWLRLSLFASASKDNYLSKFSRCPAAALCLYCLQLLPQPFLLCQPKHLQLSLSTVQLHPKSILASPSPIWFAVLAHPVPWYANCSFSFHQAFWCLEAKFCNLFQK